MFSFHDTVIANCMGGMLECHLNTALSHSFTTLIIIDALFTEVMTINKIIQHHVANSRGIYVCISIASTQITGYVHASAPLCMCFQMGTSYY